MGAAISDLVSEALSGFLELRGGRTSVGLTSRYQVADAKIKPLALGAGLWLRGSIAELQISVEALKGIFSNAPPAKVIARGVRLVIDDHAEASSVAQAKPPSSASPDLQKHLTKLIAEVDDVSVEFRLAGQTAGLTLGSLQLTPKSNSAQRLSWRVAHRQLQLHVGDASKVYIGGMRDGTLLVHVNFGDLRTPITVSLSVLAEVSLRLQAAALCTILDLAKAIEVLAVSEEESKDATRSGGGRARPFHLSIELPLVSAELEAYGEALLSCQSPEASLDVANGDFALRLSRLSVGSAGGASQSSEVAFRGSAAGGRVKLQHAFPADASRPFPPWRSAAELLAADPSFREHKDLLGLVCDGFNAEPITPADRRRPRAEGSPPAERSTRARL